jgi:hypothetical protein
MRYMLTAVLSLVTEKGNNGIRIVTSQRNAALQT